MIPGLTLSPALVLSGLLAISVGVNAWQLSMHIDTEKDLTAVKGTLTTVRGDLAAQVSLTQTCSASVATLKDEADKAAVAHAAAVAAARLENKARTTKAVKILSTPPSVPGDQCKSIAALLGDWRKGRVK